jgi:hypothetical protein
VRNEIKTMKTEIKQTIGEISRKFVIVDLDLTKP